MSFVAPDTEKKGDAGRGATLTDVDAESTPVLERQADRAAEVAAGAADGRSPGGPPPGRPPTAARRVQRAASLASVEAAIDDQAGADADVGLALIVEDDVAPLPDQIRRSDFLEIGIARVREVADEELAAAGREANSCPYITSWIAKYREMSARRLQRAIQLLAAPASETVYDYLTVLESRVRHGVRKWLHTGEVDLPAGIAVLVPTTDTAPLQRMLDGASGVGSDHGAVRGIGPGQALPSGPRAAMERAFGQDFSGVRVHTDEAAARSARSERSRAFALGDHLVFGRGEFNPSSFTGGLLLAHELAHVVQQRGGGAVAGADAEHDADRAAVDAAFGRSARPRLGGALQLQRCCPRRMDDAEAVKWFAANHLRIALLDDTTKVLAGMRGKQITVVASEKPSTELVAQPGETQLNVSDDPRILGMSYVVTPKGGTPRPGPPMTPFPRTNMFVAHFMQGEGDYTFTAVVRAGSKTERVTKTFTAGKDDFVRESVAALPRDFGKASRTLEQERLFWMLQRVEVRNKAVEAKILSSSLHDAWLELSRLIIARAAEIESRPGLTHGVEPLQKACDDFVTKLRSEPGSTHSITVIQSTIQLKAAAASTTLATVSSKAETLTDHFDGYVRFLIENALGKSDPLYQTIDHAIESERKLRDIGRKGQVTPVPAVFHARNAYVTHGLPGIGETPVNTGRIVPLPLSLWLVKTGTSSWELHDLTFPSKTFRYRSSKTAETDALNELLEKLANDKEHFPEGMFYAHPAGGSRKPYVITHPMGFGDWLTIAAIALAAIGFGLVTFGTGTAAVVGGAALVLGSAAGGAAAIVDTVNAYENGRLTKGRLALNVLQVVASAASAGSASILTKSLGQGTAAVGRLSGNARYLFLNRLATGSDVASLAIMTVDTASQLGALADSKSDEKGLQAGLLLGQLFVQGTFTVVQVRNDFAKVDLADHPPIRVTDGPTPDAPPVVKAVTAGPTPPKWTLPKTASLAGEVADKARFATALTSMDEPLRNQVLNSHKLQRALVAGDYNPADLKYAWGEWTNRGSRKVPLKSTTFEEYITKNKNFRTSDGKRFNQELTQEFKGWASMSPEKQVETLAKASHPDLMTALDNGKLPAALKSRIKAALKDEPGRFLGPTKVIGARQKFAKEFNQRLGQLATTPEELTEIVMRVSASNQGSVGEWFAHFHLIDSATRAKPSSVRHPQFTNTEVPGLTGQTFNPDRLDTAAHQTVDLKTGYHNSQIDLEQAKDYDALIRASRSDPNVRQRVGGPIERHNWLFQPADRADVTYLGKTMQSSEAAAARCWRQLENNLPGSARGRQRVFYLARDGTIHEVLSVATDGTMQIRRVGTSIADILAQ